MADHFNLEELKALVERADKAGLMPDRHVPGTPVTSFTKMILGEVPTLLSENIDLRAQVDAAAAQTVETPSNVRGDREALADMACVCREAFGHLVGCYERADKILAAGFTRPPTGL